MRELECVSQKQCLILMNIKHLHATLNVTPVLLGHLVVTPKAVTAFDHLGAEFCS